MENQLTEIIAAQFRETSENLQQMTKDAALLAAVAEVAEACIEALRQGHKVLFAGNGGSAADAQHLAAASEVGLEINLEQIPCWESVEAMAAIASGEEFELLATMPPTFGDASASAFRAQTGVHLTRIGTCLRAGGGRRGGVRIIDRNSKPVPMPTGYDHFA